MIGTAIGVAYDIVLFIPVNVCRCFRHTCRDSFWCCYGFCRLSLRLDPSALLRNRHFRDFAKDMVDSRQFVVVVSLAGCVQSLHKSLYIFPVLGRNVSIHEGIDVGYCPVLKTDCTRHESFHLLFVDALDLLSSGSPEQSHDRNDCRRKTIAFRRRIQSFHSGVCGFLVVSSNDGRLHLPILRRLAILQSLVLRCSELLFLNIETFLEFSPTFLDRQRCLSFRFSVQTVKRKGGVVALGCIVRVSTY